jgi:hypothetical protein
MILLLLFPEINAQSSINLNSIVDFTPGNHTASQAFSILEDLNNLTISYNSSLVKTGEKFKFSNSQYKLNDIFKYLLRDFNYNIVFVSEDRILLKIDTKSTYTVSGYIYDKSSGDRLGGAIIIDNLNNEVYYSNEEGFYSITIPSTAVSLSIKYLGYETLNYFTNHTSSQQYNLGLVYINNLTPVLITADPSKNFYSKSGIHRINQSSINSFGSAMGVDDMVNRIRYLPGVQSGHEGVGGLFVRGGASDQNLVLYDEIPLYEISHTAGISSIFINESINNIEVIKSAFPARYSGRLSSVINVKIKEGDQLKNNAFISFGNYGPTMNVNGPIVKSKLTYNISARTSWMHWYINPLLRNIIDYNDVDIRFTDLNAKVAWKISPNQHLSLTSYYGYDKLGLADEETSRGGSISFSIKEDITTKWSTRLVSLNYNAILSEKSHFSFNTGYISYNYQNRGSYRFRKFGLIEAFVDEVDVVSISDIKDLRAGFNFDYIPSGNHLIRLGGNITHHRYNPTIRQSTIFLSGKDIDQISDNSNLILANELNLYSQYKLKWDSNISLDAGLNYTASFVRGSNYQLLEPRLAFDFQFSKASSAQISYSRIHQFVHLLVNPGLGLPSNLWVPSTDNIRPEQSDQVDITFSQNINSNIKINLSGYYKVKEGLVEYLLSDGVYSTIINDDSFVPVFNEDKDWEDNIESGSGRVRGLDFFTEGNYKNTQYWISYSLSKSSRIFPNINEGESFPYKYDRRHDVNLGFVTNYNPRHSFGANWVYGSGTAFTLALESFPGLNGVELLNPGKRNNYRLPAFHHLDVFYQFDNKTTKTPYSFKVGIYNIYNNLNPYYVILYNDEVQNKPVLKQVSIFPLFPYVLFKTAL